MSPSRAGNRRSPEFDEAEIEVALEPVLKEILGQAPWQQPSSNRGEGNWKVPKINELYRGTTRSCKHKGMSDIRFLLVVSYGPI